MMSTETPLSRALLTTVEYILNNDLRKILERDMPVDIEKYCNTIEEFKKCYESMNCDGEGNDKEALKWLKEFNILGEHLQVSVM